MSETEPKQERRRAWVWWAGLIGAPLVLCVALQPILWPGPSPVTREAYERIEKGMTQAEVEKILGGPPGDYTTRPPAFVLLFSGFTIKPGAIPCHWLGDEMRATIYFNPDGVVVHREFDERYPADITFPDLIRWRLGRLKDRWFPPSP